MSVNQFPSDVVYTMPPQSIVNYWTGGGATGLLCGPSYNGGLGYLSGALTADTYASAISVSGRGVLFIASVYAVDATLRTVGIKVIVDGVAVFDEVSATVTGVNRGIVAIGILNNPQPIPYNSSFDIQIKSSLSETDKIGASVAYTIA